MFGIESGRKRVKMKDLIFFFVRLLLFSLSLVINTPPFYLFFLKSTLENTLPFATHPYTSSEIALVHIFERSSVAPAQQSLNSMVPNI